MDEDRDSSTHGDDAKRFGYRGELKRTLSLSHLVAYGLVFIVPIAPVSLFGIVFNASRGMVPLVYLVGFAAMAFTALSYMAISRELPLAGSVYAYASRGLGEGWGFLAGWSILLDYLLFPTLTYVACAIAVHAALPGVPEPLCIVVMVITVTLINYFGIKTTARASFVLLALQLLILTIFVAFAIRAVFRHLDGAHFSLSPMYNSSEFTPELIFGALSIAVLSFLGFDAISTLAEESRDGPAAISRATMLCLCLSAVLFIAQTWLASFFLLDRSSLPDGEAANAAFYDIADLVGGYWLKFLLAVPGIFLAGIASAVTGQTATARVLFGMARDRNLPRVLAYVEPHRGTPSHALGLVAMITLVMSLTLVSRLEFLTSLVSFGALIGFLFVHLSVIGYFVWQGRTRKWMRHLILPAVGLFVIAYVLVNTTGNAKLTGSAWMVAGLVLFAGRSWLQRSNRAIESQSARSSEGGVV